MKRIYAWITPLLLITIVGVTCSIVYHPVRYTIRPIGRPVKSGWECQILGNPMRLSEMGTVSYLTFVSSSGKPAKAGLYFSDGNACTTRRPPYRLRNCNGSGYALGTYGKTGRDPIFRMDRYGKLTPLEMGSLGDSAINDRGDIVAEVYGSHSGLFRWDSGRKSQLTMPPHMVPGALAINARRDVVTVAVERSGFGPSPVASVNAVVWNDGRPPVKYPFPSDVDTEFESLAMNESGQVVATLASPTPVVRRLPKPYLLQNGRIQALPAVAWGIASDINNKGQVVGERPAVRYLGGHQKWSTSTAFLWQRGRATDLNRLIPRSSGWILEEAHAINDAGQIAGVGRYQGQIRAFLLTPIR